MSKTIRKYQTRNKKDQYSRIEKLRLEDKYYTDVAKSHDRKIRKTGLEVDDEYPEEENENSR
jgi:hypothetical protein